LGALDVIEPPEEPAIAKLGKPGEIISPYVDGLQEGSGAIYLALRLEGPPDFSNAADGFGDMPEHHREVEIFLWKR
jgi:hypothetical protein